MTGTSLDIIKKHLNLDPTFEDDDQLLEIYANAAEQSVANYLDEDIEDLLDSDGNFPFPVQSAILLMIGNLYMVRENISVTGFTEIPNTSRFLLEPYINYKYYRDT